MLRWSIRRDDQTTWQPVPVPGCWEDAGFPVVDPGPYWYRTALEPGEVPDPARLAAGGRLWMRFGAVSYHCTVLVDGHEVGRHTGAWDPFEVEIPLAACSGPAEVQVRVEKPASLTAGPDSPPVPGRFPLRQTLSGFLPYVWGHAFGGLWQEVQLLVTGPRRLGDVWVCGAADGQVRIRGNCSASGPVVVEICGPDGRPVVDGAVNAGPAFDWTCRLPAPQPWSPRRPALYTAHLRLPEGEERRLRFGLRSLQVRGTALWLNREPLYPRLALSWGWYPDRRCPNPGPERVRADLLRLRAMGYNGVKLCLWFPPPYYFDLADDLGMMLWVELPMWLPEPSPFFSEQAPLEYGRLVRAARNHPSVLLYSLGCELSRAVDAGFLADLYQRVKMLGGDALVCDNSGSGEAYGGPLDAPADFYDHHLYCDLQFLHPLLHTFAPGWRKPKPWLMGEFADYDTVRPLPALLSSGGGKPPWWMDPDPRVNPQGARWEMRLTGHAEALRRSGLAEQIEDLLRASYRQGFLHRKVTLESVRTRPDVSGYVVTGEVDTPVSTAGMWNDLRQVKFDAEAFRAFNDDVVLSVGWDRHRAWVAGGDRPAFRDPYSHRARTTVRVHLLVCNHGPARGRADLIWEVGPPGRGPIASGEAAITRVGRGAVGEVALAEFQIPDVAHPLRLVLQARLWLGSNEYANAWPLWAYPHDPWSGLAPFGLLDPQGVLADLPRLAGSPCLRLADESELAGLAGVLVCTAWSPQTAAWVEAGGQAVLLQQRGGPPGPLPAVECPFWREALKWVEPHPAWGDFPHERDPGLQFYGLATDCALDASSLPGGMSPLLRRLDTRSLDVHEYAGVLSWGKGRLLVTTLRLHGGLGDQASSMGRNPAATHLLAGWLRFLQARVDEAA